MTNKPRWIPGAPTERGWYWIKHVKFNYAGCEEKPFIVWVGKITDDQVFMSNGHDWTGKKLIAAHSPIQEPEE